MRRRPLLVHAWYGEPWPCADTAVVRVCASVVLCAPGSKWWVGRGVIGASARAKTGAQAAALEAPVVVPTTQQIRGHDAVPRLRQRRAGRTPDEPVRVGMGQTRGALAVLPLRHRGWRQVQQRRRPRQGHGCDPTGLAAPALAPAAAGRSRRVSMMVAPRGRFTLSLTPAGLMSNYATSRTSRCVEHRGRG